MRYVLLPAIRPTITLMMIMTVIWSFLAFDFVYCADAGRPRLFERVLSTLSYRTPLQLCERPGAAVALVISFFGLVATVLLCARPAKGEGLMEQTLGRSTVALSYVVLTIGGGSSPCFPWR